ncbi:MAG: class I SAM-dependent methyltransferase [Acetobacteraceae bacterium]
MEQGKPSTTALNAAVQRALHQRVDDEPKILADQVVARLVEAAAPGALAAALATAQLPGPKGGRATMVVRSRFAEDELADAARQGVPQYVILGAGLDTFAYRQPPYAAALQIFEVDHPATQTWKRASLAAAGIPHPANLRYVPVDFGRDTLAAGLGAAGFDGTRPAACSWLGVTQYLPLPAIDDTLRFVAGLPAPSTIVLTFIVPEEAVPAEDRERLHQTVQGAARLGEPWVTFFHPDGLRARLHDLGFARVVHLAPAEANARYCAARPDGLQAMHLEHFLSATV